MRRSSSLIAATVGTSLVGVVGLAAPAQAYLDPGTGSMVLQLILGGVAGAIVIGKLYWERLKNALGFSASEPIAPGAPVSQSTEEEPPSGSEPAEKDAG